MATNPSERRYFVLYNGGGGYGGGSGGGGGVGYVFLAFSTARARRLANRVEA